MSAAQAYRPDGKTTASMTSLDWFKLSVPFEDRVRWQMLHAALVTGKSLAAICDEADLNERRMSDYFWRGSDLDLRSVAEWFFVCGIELKPMAFRKRTAPPLASQGDLR